MAMNMPTSWMAFFVISTLFVVGFVTVISVLRAAAGAVSRKSDRPTLICGGARCRAANFRHAEFCHRCGRRLT
jgi:hypothetical protein